MGFPTRHSRTALGPKRKDIAPAPYGPEYVFAADAINTTLWQVAGLNQTGFLARTQFQTAASNPPLEWSYEAWNPDQNQAAPVIDRTSAGVYTVTYPASAPDENGIAVTISLRGAAALLQIGGTDWGDAKAYVSAANVVTVTLFDDVFTNVDQIGGNYVSILVLVG